MTIGDILIASLDTMDWDTNAQSCVGTPTAAGMDGVVRMFRSNSFLFGSKFGYIPSCGSRCRPCSFETSYHFGETPHYGGDRKTVLAKLAFPLGLLPRKTDTDSEMCVVGPEALEAFLSTLRVCEYVHE